MWAMAKFPNLLLSVRASVVPTRTAGFQTCCIADFQIGWAWWFVGVLDWQTANGFGNPRYSRLGSLRNDTRRQSMNRTAGFQTSR
jgi:hypothetical protein